MPSRAQRKGFEKERDLVQRLWRHGFAAMRGPASGARAKHIFYPDVLAAYHGRIFVFEVKYRAKPEPIYIEKSKVEKLREFAERAGAEPLIAVKYGASEWVFIRPDDCHDTGSALRVDPGLLDERGVRLSEFIARVKGQRSILDYTR